MNRQKKSGDVESASHGPQFDRIPTENLACEPVEVVIPISRTGVDILFFDEADSLFGKRSEVKDSHDGLGRS